MKTTVGPWQCHVWLKPAHATLHDCNRKMDMTRVTCVCCHHEAHDWLPSGTPMYPECIGNSSGLIGHVSYGSALLRILCAASWHRGRDLHNTCLRAYAQDRLHCPGSLTSTICPAASTSRLTHVMFSHGLLTRLDMQHRCGRGMRGD